MTAFEEHKGRIPLPEEPVKEIPDGMIIPNEAPKALTSAEIAEMQGMNTGKKMEDVMRQLDPDAYKEFQKVSQEGLEKGTPEGITAGFRYMISG